MGEREGLDDWKYTEESAGDKCPFGHPWNVMERLATAEAQVAAYREALYAIQNEPSCSPVVHELAGNALAGEKP